jgi:hypothetical protein
MTHRPEGDSANFAISTIAPLFSSIAVAILSSFLPETGRREDDVNSEQHRLRHANISILSSEDI